MSRFYTVSIEKTCCRCGRRATQEIRGPRNESHGPHCERCAIVQKRRLEAVSSAPSVAAEREDKS